MSKIFSKIFDNEILATSGFTRSGKAMLMKLISTFEYVEKSHTDILLEQIYYLHKIKKIQTNTAKYLLRKNLNIIQFYNLIGRNVNYKSSDFSSVLNYHNPKLYYDRTNSKHYKLDKISNKYLFQIMLHSGLNSADLIMKSLPSLKIIEILKNPLELVYSWIKKDYGKMHVYSKPNIYILTIKFQNQILPYYAYGWEKQFLQMNQFERCAKMIFKLIDERQKQLIRLTKNQKKKLLLVNFDDLINKPEKEIIKISKFIKRKIGKKTFFVLKKEKIPRKLFDEKYNVKLEFLKKKLTTETFLKLLEYEKKHLKQFNYEKKIH